MKKIDKHSIIVMFMYKAFIDPDKCMLCSKCASAASCSLKAIFRISDEEPYAVDMTFCRGCGDCTAKCPARAVVLRNS